MNALIKTVCGHVRYFYSINIKKDKHAIEMKRFRRDRAQQNLVETFPLTSESLVYDVGGYTGEWAHIIHHKYCTRIEIFEPVSQFVSILQKRFEGNRKITINPYGVSGRTQTAPIALQGDGSSVLQQEEQVKTEICEFKAIDEILKFKGHPRIALMAINIEGAEYELLEKLLETEKHLLIDNILIQFHLVASDSKDRRDAIQKRLKASHYQTFSYDFIWENWRLRSKEDSV